MWRKHRGVVTHLLSTGVIECVLQKLRISLHCFQRPASPDGWISNTTVLQKIQQYFSCLDNILVLSQADRLTCQQINICDTEK